MRAIRILAIVGGLATVGFVTFVVTLRAVEILAPGKTARSDQRALAVPKEAANRERRAEPISPAESEPVRARPRVEIIETPAPAPSAQPVVADGDAAAEPDVPQTAAAPSLPVVATAPPEEQKTASLSVSPQAGFETSPPADEPVAAPADVAALPSPDISAEPEVEAMLPGADELQPMGSVPAPTPEPNLPTVLPGCVDPAGIREPDIARNRGRLRAVGLCIEEVRFREGGHHWDLFIITNIRKAGPLWVVPHDNENSAFDTAAYGLVKYGGTIVAVEAKERRFFEGQDPNRNFAATAGEARVCPGARAPAPKFVNAVLVRLARSQPIIALHSNSPGYQGDGRGGSGTISGKLRTATMLPFISAIAKGRFADPDTLLIVPSEIPFARNKNAQNLLSWFGARGINVMFELISPRTNDCSLSNYAMLHRVAPYFNIEVAHGDTVTQERIVDRIFEFMSSKVYVGML